MNSETKAILDAAPEEVRAARKFLHERGWNPQKVTLGEIKAIILAGRDMYEPLLASHAALVKAATPQMQLDSPVLIQHSVRYICTACQNTHIRPEIIPHKPDCRWERLRAALEAAKGVQP